MEKPARWRAFPTKDLQQVQGYDHQNRASIPRLIEANGIFISN